MAAWIDLLLVPPTDPGLARVQAEFRQAPLTVANVCRDFPEWHLGRQRYALWALDLDQAAIRACVAAARAHLAPWLLPNYDRQPHVTLSLCGFPGPGQIRADDYPPQRFQAQLQALTAASLVPFDVELGPLASFTSAPFLQIHDCDGGIARLRQLLHGENPLDNAGHYLPHLTVGLYDQAYATEEVASALEQFQPTGPGRLRIERLSLMSYQASVIAGPLARDFDFQLGPA